jgi:hypothetical protein
MVPSRVEWDVTIHYRNPGFYGDSDVHVKTQHMDVDFIVWADPSDFQGTSYYFQLVEWREGLELVSCDWTDPHYA